MHPPEWVVAAMEEIEPTVRLAWMGGEGFDPEVHYRDSVWEYLLPQGRAELGDDANVGSFYIVQLLSKRLDGETYHEPWGTAGPVFGSRYDPLRHAPHILMPVTKTSVFNGAVIRITRDMLRPWREVSFELAKEADYEARQARDAIAEDVGDRAWYGANKTGVSDTHVFADKFIPKAEKARLAGDKPPSVLDTYCQDALK